MSPKYFDDVKGFHFYFVSGDRPQPPHVHVSKGKPSRNAAKIWLEGATVSRRGMLSDTDVTKVQGIIRSRNEEMLSKWYDFFG